MLKSATYRGTTHSLLTVREYIAVLDEAWAFEVQTAHDAGVDPSTLAHKRGKDMLALDYVRTIHGACSIAKRRIPDIEDHPVDAEALILFAFEMCGFEWEKGGEVDEDDAVERPDPTSAAVAATG